MVLARETLLDKLAYRMENPVIRKLIESIIAGKTDPTIFEGEAFLICLDLGLVAMERGMLSMANPLYREIITRQITMEKNALQ